MKRALSLALVLMLLGSVAVLAAQEVVLTFDKPETAGISGTRWFWDLPAVLAEDGAMADYAYGDAMKSKQALWCNLGYHNGYGRYVVPQQMLDETGKKVPWELRSVRGALTFDAVHRSLLVRFPGAAEQIAQKMNQGMAIEKVQLVLPFKGTELVPRAYKGPTSFLINGKTWDTIKPKWHAVAWALRKPWIADVQLGPTFNAYVNGAGYWAKYGAQDTERDRFPVQFGPAEVSEETTEPVDVTALLTDEAFGKTPAERLRVLEDHGFLVRKLETYDFRFANPGYEWGTMTGGRGIFIGTPRLVVTFKPDAKAPKAGDLPKAPDVKALAERLKKDKAGGAPTARAPSQEEFEALKKEYAFKKPDWMPDWQWQRTKELYDLDGHANAFPETYRQYEEWIDDVLSTQPRRWEGFSAADQLTLFYAYEKALPPPVVDHWKLYWTSWLMPYRDTRDMVHNQYHQIWKQRWSGSDYLDETGDWRGNSSFYRESYTRLISTMNFNHTASMGALLGGAFIGSERAMEDGRFSLEHFPLRLWAWYDGTTQESIDHYYFAITLNAQKMFADYGPTHVDRMMGESIITKAVEELACCYHPGLRHFIATSTRTGLADVLVIQDGLQHIMHTLSHSGTLHDIGNADTSGMPAIGHDLPPRQVALRTVVSPWAPEWMAYMVDEKPIPFEMTTTFKQWGSYRVEPLYRRSYLGHHYGVASQDLDGGRTVPVLAQWRRVDKQVDKIQDIGTLLVRYGMNETDLLDTHMGGVVGGQGAPTCTLQHRNKMIVLTSPYYKLKGSVGVPKELTSLQTTIGLLNVPEKPTWEVYLGGKRVEAFPVKARFSGRITIKDGVSFVGIIPVPATDLGRTDEVLMYEPQKLVDLQGGGKLKPALIIESYNMKQDGPLDQQKADWDAIDRAYGGFVIELGDVTEHKDFAAFQDHIAKAGLETRWEADAETLHVTYRSGEDTMKMGFRPRQQDEAESKTMPSKYFPYRRANGKWPYMPKGVERDSTLTQTSTTGRIEKNGASLVSEPGRMTHLQTEPRTGTYAILNPLPDPTYLLLSTPEGVALEADGRLGLARVVVRPKENRLWVDYAVKDGQDTADMATVLLVSGLNARPSVERNGKPWKEVRQVKMGERTVWAIPLFEKLPSDEQITARYGRNLEAFKSAPARPLDEMAVMRYEKGQEDYLLTEPRSGYYEFQRLWPSATVFCAHIGEELEVASDGRVALLRLVMSPKDCFVQLEYPLYMQKNFEDRAKALIIWSKNGPPTVQLNGKVAPGPLQKATVNGREAYIVPLFDDAPADVANGIEERLKAAGQKLP